jgi:hypothetical protein
MILSDATIEVLQNFSAINPSMVLEWSGTVGVVAQQGNVIAIAEVPERYPYKWSIYDVPQLLSSIKVMDKAATAECFSDHVVFKHARTALKYKFTEPSLIKTIQNKTGAVKGPVFNGYLKWEELQQLFKAAMLLRNTHVTISVNQYNNSATLMSTTANNPATNQFSIDIPIVELIDPLKAQEQSLFKIEYFNLLKNEYKVCLAERCLYLESVDGKVKYWIGKEKQ